MRFTQRLPIASVRTFRIDADADTAPISFAA